MSKFDKYPYASTTAKVKLTVEVATGESWGPDCPLGQVYKQGTEAAVGKLRQILAGHKDVVIIGEPVVTAINNMMDSKNGGAS